MNEDNLKKNSFIKENCNICFLATLSIVCHMNLHCYRNFNLYSTRLDSYIEL